MQTISKITLAVAIALSASMYAQAQAPARPGNPIPTYQLTVVSGTARAVNYEHHSGSTKVNFQGTALMPNASGEAEVDSKRGTLAIETDFANLQKPTAFGSEYLTYVLWAISPEGRSANLGEVQVNDNRRGKLKVTTDLQAFALIVTAEPYYAVRRPSNAVVLENVIRKDTEGTTEVVDAKYELIDRGGYLPTGYKFDPVVLNAKLPLEFFEARNAVRIAQSAGAEQYATSSYEKATGQMRAADALATAKSVHKNDLISTSRQTVQTAEDAREIAMKNIESARADHEREAAANREAEAKAQANTEAQRRLGAEAVTADALRQRNEADGRTLSAQAAAQQAQGAQANAEADTRLAQGAQANAEADADRNRAAAAASDQQLQQAVRDREELRARLLQQFSLLFQTQDTVRGLVVSMPDVLFDTAQFTLRPQAREKLAKLSGIVLAYPTLMLAIEGNTDSVGTEVSNQTLSEKRAGSVRTYLTGQGVPEASTTATGFGKSRPIASNETADGRQQNRRVEMIVSGEVIGTKVVALTVRPIAALSSH